MKILKEVLFGTRLITATLAPTEPSVHVSIDSTAKTHEQP